MNKQMKLISIWSLIISFVILIISRGIWFRFDCHEDDEEIDTTFCLHTLLFPVLFMSIIFVDLCGSFLLHYYASGRNILVFFVILSLFGRAGIYYIDQLEEGLSSTQRFFKIAGLLLTIGSCVAFVVCGVKESKTIAVMNIIITFLLYSAVFQTLPTDDMCSSTFIVWHMLIFSVAFDIANGTKAKRTKSD